MIIKLTIVITITTNGFLIQQREFFFLIQICSWINNK